MADLVTVADFREHVESDAPDTAIERILTAIEGELNERFGDVTAFTETRTVFGRRLTLRYRPLGAIVVTEDGEALTLDTHYEAGEGALLRLGGNWGAEVTLSYTPAVDTTARRVMAILKLAALELAQSGYKTQSTPDASETPQEYEPARRAILKTLRSRRAVLA